MMKRLFLYHLLLPILGCMMLSAFTADSDPLHKRSFTISLSETRNGVVQKKVINDRLYFKNGKLYCKFIDDKFGFKWVRYRINRDTTFVDSTRAKVRQLAVEAVVTDESNQTLSMEFVTQEWDLDGVIKVTKNDRLKKYYDMAGREKGGKPKKVKKKKAPVLQLVKPGEASPHSI